MTGLLINSILNDIDAVLADFIGETIGSTPLNFSDFGACT